MKGSCSSLVGPKASGASESSLGNFQMMDPGHALYALNEASDLLVVHRDFAAALEVCERGCLAITADPESHGDYSCMDVKTSLCIVGIQALAEMNRWREVLSWLLQYYEVPEKLPVKLLEMCRFEDLPEDQDLPVDHSRTLLLSRFEDLPEDQDLPVDHSRTLLLSILLHSKVEEPLAMLEVGGKWLRHRTNQGLPGYTTVVRLFLKQVLLPLGHFEEAEDLAMKCGDFSEKQQQTFLGCIAEHRQSWDHPGLQLKTEVTKLDELLPDIKKHVDPAPHRQRTLLKFLYRALRSAGSHILSLPLKKMVLAAVIICLLMLRLDPAASLSHPLLSSLIWMLRQAWEAITPVNFMPGIYH
ncbi:peroxisome assembly protein 26 isoform X1 [Ambystoma mexicanum]|uniref:peroxisome assembly protein 26 isoform X1 n=1 Tax=Ambystoma mexicanum TaxID=8296 RepID=UPI0037E9C052